ncbi:AMP-binding protein [Stieleria sp.]|uniref:AMP-binding protein n=1 Tax=Stieleria sp. TaxID=2795976 RepID=UPI003568119F
MVGPSGNDQPTSASDDAKDRLIRPNANVLGALRDRAVEERRSSTSHPARGLSSYRNCPAFGLLQHAAEQLPDRLALIYGNARWTYRDLNSDAVRAAAMLQRLGVRPGDRVGLLLPNVPEYIIAANAIWRAGGIVLAISPLMVPGEVDALLRKTKCRHVICLDLLSNLLPDTTSETGGRQSPLQTTLLVSIRKQLPAHEQLGYLIKRGYQWLQARPQSSSNRVGWFWEEISTIERAWQPITIDPASDPAYILPTGGTTGSPKAVTLSHQNMVANAWQQYVWTRRSFGEETMLGVLPFFHSYGMSATVMGGAAMAATLVLHHRFNTNKTIQLIETHRPSVFHAVPAMLVAMNARLREYPSDKLDSLRWIISGGASLDESVAREFTEHCRYGHDETQFKGPQVVEGFGLSEASPVTHVGHLFQEPIYGRIGLPLPMTECRIVDANAEPGEPERPVPDGEVGELCVRGPQVMLGYWGDHEATRMAIRDGWLHTGDLAIRHDDGWYSIVGRKKDLIITSGFNVYPSEVESVLCQAENVKDAAVVAMPDEIRGEAVHAYIVTVDGSPPDVEALEAHCRDHLSAHKRPRAYTHCPDDLPRNFLGKVIRRELRETQSADN